VGVQFNSRNVAVSDPGQPGDPAALPRVRFLLAHAAAHAMEDRLACTFPRMGDGEEMACGIATHLLCPPSLLEVALRSSLDQHEHGAGTESTSQADLLSQAGDPWRPDIGRVISAVAHRLAVPGWVAVRRLAEESLLDDEALYYSPGGRQ
jgi:hypothetical protein